MIDNICLYLTKKIREEMPEIDDERAEAINYGLQLMIGEFPKFFITLAIAYFLGIFKLTIVSFFIILPYRAIAGGFHLHTHLGCIICTTALYCGTALFGKIQPISYDLVIPFAIAIWIFAIFCIYLYAPADTENCPILRKKDRKIRRILAYCLVSIFMIIASIVPNLIISNIILFGTLIQTCTITRIAYKLTKNKYGYEVY